ncbi:MAG TPA: FHA domain-containing protein [Chloroflexia bacterium]|nr:FHA domain-containing protein [Chloroflexia bacterium]
MSGDLIGNRAGQARLMLRFEVVEGQRAGETITVPLPEPGEPPIVIGRSRECTIWIDARDISRRHTEIISGPDRRPLIRDIGSINGTLVNGQPVSQTTPLPLRPGDNIRVGLTELIFSGMLTQAAPQPQPVQPLPSFPSFGPASHSSPLSSAGITAPSPIRPAILPGNYYIYIVIRNGQRYLFEGEEVTVGRGQGNDIVIDSNSISRQHARLQKTVAGVFVQDLGSTNKTFVNNVQADGPVLLRDGDVLRFGDVEADFKLEPQRLTNYTRLVSRSGTIGLDNSLEELYGEITQRDNTTFVTPETDQTFIGKSGGIGFPFPAGLRKEFEQSETALDIDIRVVGRNLRQAADVVPEQVTNAPKAETLVAGGAFTEVAHLDSVFLTEGTGRSVDQLLNNVRIGLKPGELVALVGPSGSGKTELLQVMAGLRAADRGQVTVLGRTLPTVESAGGVRPNLEADRELTRWRLRSTGYLPGELEFNNRQTALEHITFVLEEAGFGRDPRDRVEKALQQLQAVGLTDPEIPRLRPAELNRTERRLLALARVFVLDPPLLLLDEPTGRVHSDAANKIFQLLKQMATNGKSVFMVTSDLLWARNADRQVEILDGAIVGGLS